METKNLKGQLTILLFFALQVVVAQTYIGNDKDAVVIGGENITPLVLASLGMDITSNANNSSIHGNNILLEQIGDFNRADIQTQTESSEINLKQNGNYNYTSLKYTVNSAYADLLQDGDNNTIIDNVDEHFQDISLELIQEGDYLNFQREGVNELTKSLKFKQTEASPTLIIRSFP